MTDRTKAILEKDRLLEELYRTRTTKEYSCMVAEIHFLINQWSYTTDKEINAVLIYSKLLQTLGSFSVQHIQSTQIPSPASLKSTASSLFQDYIDLCFPLGS